MTESTQQNPTTASAGLQAVALVCTLTPSPKPSSSELMARHVLGELEKNGVASSAIRVVDHDVRPGVQVDMGCGRSRTLRGPSPATRSPGARWGRAAGGRPA